MQEIQFVSRLEATIFECLPCTHSLQLASELAPNVVEYLP